MLDILYSLLNRAADLILLYFLEKVLQIFSQYRKKSF